MKKPEIRDQRSEVSGQKSESGIRHSSFAKASAGRPASDFSRLVSGVWRLASSSAGFSLVEVTLALMVMAIGILSIMSLFPAGLDQNIRSIADTHAAFFAEEVFGGLQAKAETNWDNLKEFNVPAAADDMWHPDLANVHATNSTGLATNIYKYPVSPYYEDHALRYRLVVTNAGSNGLLQSATLWVWPGEFGGTNEPAMFYAEFFRWKPR